MANSALDSLVGLIPVAIGAGIVMGVTERYFGRSRDRFRRGAERSTVRSGVRRTFAPRSLAYRRSFEMHNPFHEFAENGRLFRQHSGGRKPVTRKGLPRAYNLALDDMRRQLHGKSITGGLNKKALLKIY